MRCADVARVTEGRWIALLSTGSIDFGLKPSRELKVETMVCHEVRQSRRGVVIDQKPTPSPRLLRRGAPRVPAQILAHLNPIEQVFAKFKTLLRKAEARTYDAVANASAAILAQYSTEECSAYVKNAGTRKPKCRRL